MVDLLLTISWFLPLDLASFLFKEKLTTMTSSTSQRVDRAGSPTCWWRGQASRRGQGSAGGPVEASCRGGRARQLAILALRLLGLTFYSMFILFSSFYIWLDFASPLKATSLSLSLPTPPSILPLSLLCPLLSPPLSSLKTNPPS